MEPIIEIKNLTHIYSPNTPFEQRALDSVNLTIYQGETLGIIGRTGSGKSTLIQHLNGLVRPTSGQILFEGQDIWSSKELTHTIRFQVGLVFQYPEYQLFEETVYKDIAFGPRNMKLDEGEIDRRVRRAAAFAGLRDEVLSGRPTTPPLSLSAIPWRMWPDWLTGWWWSVRGPFPMWGPLGRSFPTGKP